MLSFVISVLLWVLSESVAPTPNTAAPKILCPPGATIDPSGQGCQIRKYTDAYDFVCPPGHTRRENSLRRNGEPTLFCEQTRVVPTIHDCERGYQFVAPNTCRRIARSAPVASCPNGFKLDGTSCVKFFRTDAELKCPSEMGGNVTHKAKICHQTVSHPPLLECPKGYTLKRQNGICSLEETVEPAMGCPKGFKRTSDGTACIGESDVISAEFECPENTSPRGGGRTCVKRDVTPAVPFCRQDHQLHLNEAVGLTADLRTATCVKLVKEEPEYRCMKGLQSSGDLCLRRREVDSLLECPIGSYKDGNKCTVRHTVPLEPSCPNGFEASLPSIRNGHITCERTITLPLMTSCDDGYIASNGICRKTFFVDEVS